MGKNGKGGKKKKSQLNDNITLFPSNSPRLPRIRPGGPQQSNKAAEPSIPNPGPADPDSRAHHLTVEIAYGLHQWAELVTIC